MTGSAESDPSIQRAQNAAAIFSPDPTHSLHIAFLCLQLFDQLQQTLELDPGLRDILAAAALWHDTGQKRSMRNHHLHTFDLIIAEFVRDFSDVERLMIANVARYHRHSTPSRDHSGYVKLTRTSRADVDRLAALLRVAEPLDAGHLQSVTGVVCQVSTELIDVGLLSVAYPTIEIELARARAGMFRDVFNRGLTFHWVRPGPVVR